MCIYMGRTCQESDGKDGLRGRIEEVRNGVLTIYYKSN